ncbi:hypothetical protein FRC11_009479, partial [Ceratobasidium sp. 423]
NFPTPKTNGSQPSASTSRAIGPSTIPIPTVRPTIVGSDERITQTSGDHMGLPASEPVIVDDPASPERLQAPKRASRSWLPLLLGFNPLNFNRFREEQETAPRF